MVNIMQYICANIHFTLFYPLFHVPRQNSVEMLQQKSLTVSSLT